MLLIILATLAVVFSVVLSFMVWSNYWPSVVGELIDSNHKVITMNGRTGYRIDVTYKFYVDQKKNVSNTLVLLGDGLHKSQSDAENVIDNLKSKPLAVFYCPMYPSISYIKRNTKHIPIITVTLIVTILAAVFVGIIVNN